MTERLQALAAALPEEIDAALIQSPVGRQYYTGFESSAGTLLVTRAGSVLIIDSRYREAAAREIAGCEVILQDKLYAQIIEQLGRLGARRVAVESGRTTLREFASLREKLSGEGDNAVELCDDNRLGDLIAKQRRRKSPEELALIRQAQALADKSFLHILDYIKPGLTERQIALELEFYYRKLGSEDNAFAIIAVSGPNSSMPHGRPGDRAVRKGDMLTLDFGCVVGGYRSDMTRTVAVGEPGERCRQVYDTVLRAQLAALDAMRPGALCREVDAAARSLIAGAGFGDYFGHGLGHSLGLEVHEDPACNPTSEAALEEGMMMTAEPGIYIPGEFGVRIEDLVVITAGGHDNLTASDKSLIVL